MKTAIENNIKCHYLNRVRLFVNRYYNQEMKEECKSIQDMKNRAEQRKVFRKELYAIKQDMILNTLKSPEKYHKWILEHRLNLSPGFTQIEDLMADLYKHPQSYLKYLIYMSRTLETDKKKSFQFFPLRSKLTPAHIALDTTALITLFSVGPLNENKAIQKKHIMEIRDEVWGDILVNKPFVDKRKHFYFNYMITTNGYDASILYASLEEFDKNETKKTKKMTAKRKIAKENKGKTEEEKDILKELRDEQRKEKDEQQELEYKNTPKEKKPIIREFPYLEDTSDKRLRTFNNNNTGIIDWGKLRIITMLNRKTKKIFKYTKKEHLFRTQRYKIRYQTLNLKKKLKINVIEEAFTEQIKDKCSSKSCIIENFQQYISIRNNILLDLSEKYAETRFRKLKFNSYINTQRAHAKLINNMKSFLGEKSKLVIGNWSANKNMKHTEPVPGIGLKRKLAKHFKIYDIDEYKTSAINCKNEQKNENLYLKDRKTQTFEKIHSILTYTMENGRLGCINRDKNAVFNMDKIVSQILVDRTYPKVFDRTKSLPTPVLGVNGS
jgi:hypothetical protein